MISTKYNTANCKNQKMFGYCMQNQKKMFGTPFYCKIN